MVDPCTFLLMLNDTVAEMLVAHVGAMKIAATNEVRNSMVADLSQKFHTIHLGEVTW